MPDLPVDKVQQGFAKPGLLVLNDRAALEQWLKEQAYQDATLLFMSSGNYDGLDMLTFAKQITE